MKRLILMVVTLVLAVSLIGCSSNKSNSSSQSSIYSSSGVMSDIESSTNSMASDIKDNLTNNDYMNRTHKDGTYRGAYINPKDVQVEFIVKNNKFEKFDFIALGYNGEDYLKSADTKAKDIANQYQKLADNLIGKNVFALDPLYKPEIILNDNTKMTDEFHSGKLVSAINDALNRGVFEPYDMVNTGEMTSSSGTDLSSSSSLTSSSSSLPSSSSK